MNDSWKLPPGAVFVDEYRIVSRLSGGGMGAVYVAEQKSTGIERALKVMHPELVKDDKLRERFVQEARVGARIKSDHVVQVIGAGIEPDTNTPWIAMELLEGRDLASLVDEEGPLPPVDALRIFRQLCHAIGAAHHAGIVHRDLKPENVFLADSRHAFERFTVKVLDFGLAKVIAEAKGKQTDALGTPLWMAPEQAELGGEITPATDVWALGLIAFWLLTGKDYWKTAGQDSPNVPAIIREVLFDPFEPASKRGDEVGAATELPEGFDEWFSCCVTRDVGRRYSNATEAFDALEPILAKAAGVEDSDEARTSREGSLSDREIPLRSSRPDEDEASRRQAATAVTLSAQQLEGQMAAEKPAKRGGAGRLLVAVLVLLLGAAAAVRFVPAVRSAVPPNVRHYLPAAIVGEDPSPGPTETPEPVVAESPVSSEPTEEPESERAEEAVAPADAAAPEPAGDASARAAAPASASASPGAAAPVAGGFNPRAEDEEQPLPDPSSVPTTKRPFPTAAANAAAQRAAGSASSCHSGESAQVTVTVVWGTSGTPHATTVSNAPTPGVASCIRGHFASLSIPPFDGTVHRIAVTFEVGG